MRKYSRKDFLKLPANTIYSRISTQYDELMYGLFCKVSNNKQCPSDWVEQDLIGEPGFPNEISEGTEAIEYQLNLRDTFQDFTTDLQCGGRDGMFDEKDEFIVWDTQDITKLINYLNTALEWQKLRG